jgi:hypothetical protein
MQTLTLDFQLDHEISSLWFEYELTPEQFFESFPSGVLPALSYLPREYQTGSMGWLEERIKEAIVKDEIMNGQRTLYTIFIDHVHFLWHMFRSKNPSLELGEIVRQLKTIAIQNDLIIFLACHMTKTKFGEEPSAYDARDSSFFVGECDKAFCMWRLKEEHNVAVIKIEVDRRTGTLARKFKVIKTPEGYIRELEEMIDEPEGKSDWSNKY